MDIPTHLQSHTDTATTAADPTTGGTTGGKKTIFDTNKLAIFCRVFRRILRMSVFI